MARVNSLQGNDAVVVCSVFCLKSDLVTLAAGARRIDHCDVSEMTFQYDIYTARKLCLRGLLFFISGTFFYTIVGRILRSSYLILRLAKLEESVGRTLNDD